MDILSSSYQFTPEQIISVLSFGVRCIAVIDSEGIVVRTGGSRKYKKTTFIVRKIGYAKYDITDGSIKSGSILVRLPRLEKGRLRDNILRQWEMTRDIHGLEWIDNDTTGIPIEDAYEMLNRMLYNSIGKCLLLAKGTALEDRLLSYEGLQLNEAIIRNVNFEHFIFDLTNIGAPKIDNVMTIVHDPLIECMFFLKYSMLNIDTIVDKILEDYKENIGKLTEYKIMSIDDYMRLKKLITIQYESRENDNNWIEWLIISRDELNI